MTRTNKLTTEKGLLRPKLPVYEIQDVDEPNLLRDIYPYDEVPKVQFDHKVVPLDPAEDMFPSWTPDGRISFIRNGAIMVMDADGGRLENLSERFTSNLIVSSPVTWSPDGMALAFSSRSNGNIYVVRLRDLQPVDITDEPEGSNSYPAWSRR